MENKPEAEPTVEPVITKSDVEKAKEEIEAILAKYPTILLTVSHTVQVTEKPKE